MQFDYSPFYEMIDGTALQPWLTQLPALIEKGLSPERHGRRPEFDQILGDLPSLILSQIELNDSVTVTGELSELLEPNLKRLQPWRKGPFSIHEVKIDTEWRSDWKWERVLPHLESLAGKRVLDVGCGNGYYLWRMLGAGAKQAIGIDPSILFISQFFAIKKYLPNTNAWALPVGIENLPPAPGDFDTVFSMGVLYHRRSPLDHLLQLKDYLKPEGQLVLETLVVDGPLGYSLMPEDRYAKMKNVFFIPSVLTLEHWLRRCGYQQIHAVDVTSTTTEEQRSTPWMLFESLATFLDPKDASKTVEGYPAPKRAVIVAKSSK